MSYNWLLSKSETGQLSAIMDIWDRMLVSGWTEADARKRVTVAASAVDTTNNLINASGHGYSNGQPIFYHTDGTAIGGLTGQTGYFVVGAATNTFQIAASVN